jgi:hypothetical protein
MKNLYIVVHPPTGIWEFAALEEDQPEGLVKGYLLEKRAEGFLYDQIESSEKVNDIQQLMNEMEVIKIGVENNENQIILNGPSIIFLDGDN